MKYDTAIKYISNLSCPVYWIWS